MAGKAKKVVAAECRSCGATANEAFLERIKGTDEYICDECAAEEGITAGGAFSEKEEDDFFGADDDDPGGLEPDEDKFMEDDEDDFYGNNGSGYDEDDYDGGRNEDSYY